jgi:hypothetical protein
MVIPVSINIHIYYDLSCQSGITFPVLYILSTPEKHGISINLSSGFIYIIREISSKSQVIPYIYARIGLNWITVIIIEL